MSLNERIYYASPIVMIMRNTDNGTMPMIVLRHTGEPTSEDWSDINKALNLCEMELTGEPSLGRDKIWSCMVQEKRRGERDEEVYYPS